MITEGIKKKLLQIDRLAMLAIASVHRRTPTRGLAVIYNITPLTLIIKEQGLAAYVRQKSKMPSTWPGRGLAKRYSIGHRLYWEKVLRDQECDLLGTEDDTCRERIWERNYRINRDSFNGNKKHQTPTQYNAYTCLLYTSPSPRDS